MIEWKFETVTNGVRLYEHTKKASSLISAECCNYDKGNCVLLDNGVGHKCSQVVSDKICCGWFLKAVLPLDKKLEANIFSKDSKPGEKGHIKKCAICKKGIDSNSNRSKYCPICAKKVMKKQQAEYARKKRALVEN